MKLLQSSQTKRAYSSGAFILILIMIFALFSGGQARVNASDDLSLQQLLLEAVEKSNELADERRNVSDLERELARLRANAGWQYDLNMSYNRGEQVQLSGDEPGPSELSGTQERYNISIDGGRSFLAGLNLTTDLTILDSADLDFDDSY